MKTAMIVMSTVTEPTRTGDATSEAVPRRLTSPGGSRASDRPKADRWAWTLAAAAGDPSAGADRGGSSLPVAGRLAASRCRVARVAGPPPADPADGARPAVPPA